ncbi:MAG TPA: hypothetical protein V6C69_18705 [Trichormus sp.]|jgi:hypothetical protein
MKTQSSKSLLPGLALGLILTMAGSLCASASQRSEGFSDNIFAWNSDVPRNENDNTVARLLTKISGTGGIKIHSQLVGGTKFTYGHYEVTIDGSGISQAGMNTVNTDHDFNAIAGTLYFVSKPAICTLPSAADLAGKEILIWNAIAGGGAVTYDTTDNQTISGSASGSVMNSTPYKLDRFMSNGSNWFKE